MTKEYIKGWNDALEAAIKEARTMAQNTRPHLDRGYTDYVEREAVKAAVLTLGVWANSQKMS